MELEPQPQTPFEVQIDRRPRLEEPLPVRLVAVNDVKLPAPAGSERELDSFYCDLLRFVLASDPQPSQPTRIYRADNFCLCIEFQDGLIERADYRRTQVEVPSLSEIELQLIDREMEYTRQKALAVGQESLLLQDPAGNWIEILEERPIR